jgi:peroxiredoxin
MRWLNDAARLLILPEDLPSPVDDGVADHLAGMPMPSLALLSTRGDSIRVDLLQEGFARLVIYAFPMTGLPGVELPSGWDEIPGARGCTPESCGFRDHAADLADEGASVAGVSTQSGAYQREVAERLALSFPLMSDSGLQLTRALRLPAFSLDLAPDYDGGDPAG